jgi:hypothetical protein
VAQNNDDMIWIVDAARVYDRSRAWLDSQIKAGQLTKYLFRGDKRVYLSRRELEQFLAAQADRRDASARDAAKRDDIH